jgi:hypothetical protein
MPMPHINRANTFHSGTESELRGRSRSRYQPQPQPEIEEFSEEEERPRHRDHRSKHRSSRHKQSPSPPPRAEYVRAIPAPQTRYTVTHDGRAVPVQSYFEDSSRSSRKHAKEYYGSPKMPHRVVEVRPPGPARESSWGSSYGSPSPAIPKFKTSKAFDESDIHYSGVPRSSYRPQEYWTPA